MSKRRCIDKPLLKSEIFYLHTIRSHSIMNQEVASIREFIKSESCQTKDRSVNWLQEKTATMVTLSRAM